MIKLTKNKVAIQPRFDPETTEGGIIIPDIAKERCDQGIVKYIGPDVKDIKVGDYVMFGGYDGTTIQFGKDGEGTLIFLHEPFIKCKLLGFATEIPGLYFKSKIDEEGLKRDFADILINLKLDTLTVNECIQACTKIMGKHDPYFQATYEIATQIIMEAFSNDPDKPTILSKIHDREKTDHIEVEDDD